MEKQTIEIPALVDLHVHFREPGFEYKETIESGARAAESAGYSDVFTMPNLKPAPDSLDTLQVQLDAINRAEANGCKTHVHPYGCITIGQRGAGELVDFKALAPYVAGFSDDGRGVQADDLMEEAMRRCAEINKPIVAHCEVNELLRGGYIHDGEYAKLHNHKGICSESEWRQVERDIQLAKRTGCQYHVCHISTKESVELIRQGKKEGVKVTCETGPHYLLLNDMDLQEDGRFKMNPPLRSKADQQALIEGIIDGTIDCIATDHAPHSAEEKARGLSGSAFGIVGLETAFPLMYTYFVQKGIISLEKLIDIMSLNARRIMRIDTPVNQGTGTWFTERNSVQSEPRTCPLVHFDISTEWTIDPQKFLSKGKATPFSGWKVVGKLIN